MLALSVKITDIDAAVEYTVHVRRIYYSMTNHCSEQIGQYEVLLQTHNYYFPTEQVC